MVIERTSDLKLDEVEHALRRAAQGHKASVSAVERTGAGIVFTILQPELDSKLLAAEMRMAALLPCRIAAHEKSGRVVLVALSPAAFCRALGRPDLVDLAESEESLLTELLEAAAKPATMTAGHDSGATGATEDQVNMQATLPQRIDDHGSKISDIAGTGENDAPGG